MRHRKEIVELTSEERAYEHERLQAFLDAYNKYPVSVMADVPDPTVTERLVSQANALDDYEQLL